MTITDDYLRLLLRQFESDTELRRVSHIVCFRPCLVCKLLEKLNKPIIVISSSRYEEGVASVRDWMMWNVFLQDLEDLPKNEVAANNHYDLEYLRYFSGVNPLYLPNSCSYIHYMYEPSENSFAVAPMGHDKKLSNWFMETLLASLEKRNFLGGVPTVKYCDNLYTTMTHKEISAYRGIIYVPHQVSIIQMCEHYQLGMPMFVPNLELLTTWHVDYGVITEKTLKTTKELIKDQHNHPLPTSIPGPARSFDPNSDSDAGSVRFWLRFADFYQWPNIIQYESFDHLVYQLQSTNLRHVSNKMGEHSQTLMYDLQVKWTRILSEK